MADKKPEGEKAHPAGPEAFFAALVESMKAQTEALVALKETVAALAPAKPNLEAEAKLKAERKAKIAELKAKAPKFNGPDGKGGVTVVAKYKVGKSGAYRAGRQFAADEDIHLPVSEDPSFTFEHCETKPPTADEKAGLTPVVEGRAADQKVA